MFLRFTAILFAILLPLETSSARTLAGSQWRPPGRTVINKCLIFPPKGFVATGGNGGLSSGEGFSGFAGTGNGTSSAVIGGANVYGGGGSVNIPKTPCKPPPPGTFGINLVDLGPDIPNYCGEGLSYTPSSGSLGGGGGAGGGIGGGGFGGILSGNSGENPYYFIAGKGTTYPLLPVCTSYQLLRHDQRSWQY